MGSSAAEQEPPAPFLEKGHKSVTASGSAFSRYRKVVVGSSEFSRLLRYELGCLCSPLRGAPGFLLRGILWPGLFGACGQGTQFGANITLMHPHRIFVGRRGVFGDNCILDARSPEFERVIELGENVMFSHGVMLSAVGGRISLGSNIGLGAYTVVRSSKENPVAIGSNVAIGPQCYITGGGNYNTDRLDIPIAQQGGQVLGGSRIEEGVWIGAHATVLGGVTIGRDSIIGAGAVVTKSIPERAIAVGVPARVIKMRE
jgi:acetyltransferase-like isoleucine patch superfamily enzyme